MEKPIKLRSAGLALGRRRCLLRQSRSAKSGASRGARPRGRRNPVYRHLGRGDRSERRPFPAVARIRSFVAHRSGGERKGAKRRSRLPAKCLLGRRHRCGPVARQGASGRRRLSPDQQLSQAQHARAMGQIRHCRCENAECRFQSSRHLPRRQRQRPGATRNPSSSAKSWIMRSREVDVCAAAATLPRSP